MNWGDQPYGSTARFPFAGEPFFYQRGTVWWIKYSRAGRAFYESSGSTKH